MCSSFLDPAGIFDKGGGGGGGFFSTLKAAMAARAAPAPSPVEDAATAEAKSKQDAVKSRLVTTRRRRALSLLATAGEGDTALPEVAKPAVSGKQQLGA